MTSKQREKIREFCAAHRDCTPVPWIGALETSEIITHAREWCGISDAMERIAREIVKHGPA